MFFTKNNARFRIYESDRREWDARYMYRMFPIAQAGFRNPIQSFKFQWVSLFPRDPKFRIFRFVHLRRRVALTRRKRWFPEGKVSGAFWNSLYDDATKIRAAIYSLISSTCSNAHKHARRDFAFSRRCEPSILLDRWIMRSRSHLTRVKSTWLVTRRGYVRKNQVQNTLLPDALKFLR